MALPPNPVFQSVAPPAMHAQAADLLAARLRSQLSRVGGPMMVPPGAQQQARFQALAAALNGGGPVPAQPFPGYPGGQSGGGQMVPGTPPVPPRPVDQGFGPGAGDPFANGNYPIRHRPTPPPGPGAIPPHGGPISPIIGSRGIGYEPPIRRFGNLAGAAGAF